MAGPLQQLVKSGGQTLQGSQASVQGLARAAGIPAAPTAPLQAATIGASPDAAKMAGTPANQQANAVRLAVQQSRSLGTQLREQQYQASAGQSAEAAAAAQAAQQLQGLGTLQARVGQAAQQKLVSAATLAKPTLTVSDVGWQGLLDSNPSIAALPADQQKRLRDEADAAAKSGDWAKVDADLSNAAGHQVDGEHLKATLTHEEDSVAAAMQSGLSADQVKLGDLNFEQDLGIKPEDLASTLGLPNADAVKGLTVQGLSDAVQAMKERDFAGIDGFRDVLNDPTASPNQRAAAAAILRAAGTTGIATSEHQVEQVAQQVAAANTISVFGKQVPVATALKDPQVLGLVQDALSSPEKMKALADDPSTKDLAAALQKDQQVWADAASKVTAGAADVAAAAKTKSDLLGKASLTDAQADLLGLPKFATSADMKAALDKMPGLQFIAQNPTSAMKTAVGILLTNGATGATSAAAAKQLLASPPKGWTDADFHNVAQNAASLDSLHSAQTKGQSADAVYQVLGIDPKQGQVAAAALSTLNAIHGIIDPKVFGPAAALFNGANLGNASDVAAYASKLLGNGSLDALKSAGDLHATGNAIAKGLDALKQQAASGSAQGLVIKAVLDAGGKPLGNAAWSQVFSSAADLNQLDEMAKFAPAGVRGLLQQEQQHRIDRDISDMIGTTAQGQTFHNVDEVRSALDDPNTFKSPAAFEQMKALMGSLKQAVQAGVQPNKQDTGTLNALIKKWDAGVALKDRGTQPGQDVTGKHTGISEDTSTKIGKSSNKPGVTVTEAPSGSGVYTGNQASPSKSPTLKEKVQQASDLSAAPLTAAGQGTAHAAGVVGAPPPPTLLPKTDVQTAVSTARNPKKPGSLV